MLVLRAILIAALLLAAVLIGAPVQLLLHRFALPGSSLLPRAFCRSLLALLHVRIVGLGGGPDPSARLVVSNHVSWLDTLALCSVDPVAFLAKVEVRGWPLLGALARAQGCVFIDRRRRRGIPAANRDMAACLEGGRSILLFPEGTTFDGTRRGRFLTSHLACLRDRMADATNHASPVQPVAVAYSNPAAAWVGDATLLPHIWTILALPELTCSITYGSTRFVGLGFDRKQLGRDLANDIECMLSEMTQSTAVHPV